MTFTAEVERIWMRRTTGATIVFVMTRWVAVAERIALVISAVLRTSDDIVSDSSVSPYFDADVKDRGIVLAPMTLL